MSAVLQLLNDYQTLIVIVAIGFAVYFYFQLKKDNQLLQKDVQNNYDKQQIVMDQIDEHLTNHVTGTESKIEKLETKIENLEIKMDAKFDKTDIKIDQLRADMSTKLDSNFKHLNLRLDQLFSPKEKV